MRREIERDPGHDAGFVRHQVAVSRHGQIVHARGAVQRDHVVIVDQRQGLLRDLPLLLQV